MWNGHVWIAFLTCGVSHFRPMRRFASEHGVLGVRDSLSLCDVAHQTLATFGDGHHRRGDLVAPSICDDHGRAAFDDGDARVEGS